MALRFVAYRVSRLQSLLATVAVGVGLAAAVSFPAEARHRHGGIHRHAVHRHVVHHRASVRHAQRRNGRHSHAVAAAETAPRSGFLRPTYASIIVDANTGRTLSATNENAPHHPASVTKVMTLYLLFEQLEQGRLRLDSDLTISAHAAAQQPTKLGLRPGATIEVEDAIKAVVTKSANDVAAAIAENIAGDEPSFADLMTRRARSLGMNGTTFRNASGLPNPGQITTARDLAILGRAIQDRFPRYYKYFATRTFYYAGRGHPNHNHLLGRVEGMDGIKTGYTAASGFNLLTSVRRDGRYIVGVVLGGRSGGQRDHIMAGLIEDNLSDASARRTAVAIAERDDEMSRESARVMEAAPDADAPPAPRKIVRAEAEARAPEQRIEPRAEPRVEPRVEARRVASLDLSVPTPQTKIEARVEKPRPAFVTAIRLDPEAPAPSGRAARRAALEGSTGRPLAYAAPATATPSSFRWVEGARGRVAAHANEEKPAAHRTEVAKASAKSDEKADTKPAEKIALVRPNHTGWMIQIGATEDADKANALLARAKSTAGLGGAKPFTEKVHKGSETLWRARFAGLEEDSAANACRTLKRSGFSCFATRN